MATPRIRLDWSGGTPVLEISKSGKNVRTARPDEMLWSSRFISPTIRQLGSFVSNSGQDRIVNFDRTLRRRPMVLCTLTQSSGGTVYTTPLQAPRQNHMGDDERDVVITTSRVYFNLPAPISGTSTRTVRYIVAEVGG